MDLTDLFIGMSTKQKQKQKILENNNFTRFPLDASFQGIRRLFVLVFDNTQEGAKKFERNNHTIILIDGRNFYDQPINDTIKQHDAIRKIATGHGDDYTIVCLLDYQYFKEHYNLITIDLSKQKELDADSRAIQQMSFMGC